jgi:hypothetical protein
MYIGQAILLSSSTHGPLFWTAVYSGHYALCGLALAILLLWYEWILTALTLKPNFRSDLSLIKVSSKNFSFENFHNVEEIHTQEGLELKISKISWF